nr:nsp2TF protein [Lactate dehydrogenase-elevating virus]
YSPPGDGACGLHCISAIINDIFGDALCTKLTNCSRDSSEWLSDQDMYQLVMTARLPATLGHCPSATYKLDCVNQHWTVTKRKGDRALGGLSPECVRGVCGGECKFVPTYPREINLELAAKSPISALAFSLGVEPYCDCWNFTNSVLVNDSLAVETARAGEAYRSAMGIPKDDWVLLAELMTENCLTRREVLDKLQRGLRLHATSKPGSPASVSPASSIDFSAAGLLLDGTESDKEAVVAVNNDCYTVLGFDKNSATKSEQELATGLFSELVEPMETSTSKHESRKILEAASRALKSAKPKRKRNKKKKTSSPTPTPPETPTREVPGAIEVVSGDEEAGACESATIVPDKAQARPPPRPKRQALKKAEQGFILKDIIWNPTESGVKCLTIVEDVRAFLKSITPPGGALGTRARITAHIVEQFHVIRESTPELVLAHAEHQAKNMHELLLSEKAKLILGIGEDTLKKLVSSQRSLPRSIGFGAWLSDQQKTADSCGEREFVEVPLKSGAEPTPSKRDLGVSLGDQLSQDGAPRLSSSTACEIKERVPPIKDSGGGLGQKFMAWLNHQVFFSCPPISSPCGLSCSDLAKSLIGLIMFTHCFAYVVCCYAFTSQPLDSSPLPVVFLGLLGEFAYLFFLFGFVLQWWCSRRSYLNLGLSVPVLRLSVRQLLSGIPVMVFTDLLTILVLVWWAPWQDLLLAWWAAHGIIGFTSFALWWFWTWDSCFLPWLCVEGAKSVSASV